MNKLLLALGIPFVSIAVFASPLSVTCHPEKADSQQAGAFLSSFDLAVQPGVSATISNAKLGPGLVDLDNDNHVPVVQMPDSDSGRVTHTKRGLPSGVQRFSRFHKIFESESFTLTIDVLPSADGAQVKTYWRSTDDMTVNELYSCE